MRGGRWKLGGGIHGRHGFITTMTASIRTIPVLRDSIVINNFQLFGAHFLDLAGPSAVDEAASSASRLLIAVSDTSGRCSIATIRRAMCVPTPPTVQPATWLCSGVAVS